MSLCIRFILVVSCFTIFSLNAYGKQFSGKDEALRELRALNRLKAGGAIHDSIYAGKVLKWFEAQSAQGFFYTRKELEEELQLYKEVLSKGNMQNEGDLINYYYFLFSNAVMAGRYGECFYYLEKAEAEIRKKNVGKPVNSILYRAEVYIQYKNYEQVKLLYAQNRDYFLQFPHLIDKNEIDFNLGINLAHGIIHFARTFGQVADSANINEVVRLSNQLCTVLKKKSAQKCHIFLQFNLMTCKYSLKENASI